MCCTTYRLSEIVQDSNVQDEKTQCLVSYSVDGSYDPQNHGVTFEKQFENPTDSSASASALNMGSKTKNGRINYDADDNRLETTAEFAFHGFAAGAITNESRLTFRPSTPSHADIAAHNESWRRNGSLAGNGEKGSSFRFPLEKEKVKVRIVDTLEMDTRIRQCHFL